MAPIHTKKPASAPHGTQAWLACVRAYNLCDAVMAARLAEIDLRVGDLEVLATLATTPGISQQELAQRCFVTKSGVSMLLSQMEARNWVARESHATDARTKCLTLTPQGQQIAKQAMAIQTEVVAGMVAGASEAEMQVIQHTMERASRQLQGLLEQTKSR